ncbi:MAG TPA: hypothetical protein VF101_05550 [Gaiellaceae bacterium]
MPRARLLAEAADHLRASAAEIAATGVDPAAAEEQAVVRFGAAALLARRFAQSVVTASVRMALLWAATAWACYAVAAGLFVLAAPSWLHDFPQGAPSMLGLQVAAVALAVSGVRVFSFREQPLIDDLRLRLVAKGVAIATAAVLAAAVLELALALTRPAPAPWRDAAPIIAAYAIGVAATVVAGLAAVAAAARAGHAELAPAVATLVDDVGAGAPRLRPLALWLTSRPLLACTAVAGLAFAATTAVGVAGNGLAGAGATGALEAAAVVIGYLTLGRALGLRAPRHAVAD